MDLASATAATFLPHVGTTFHLVAAEATVPLELTAVEPPAGRPFVLTLTGPPKPLAPQATWPLQHEALGAIELFLVPRAQSADATTYDATFA